jgi:hypothetical protein
MSVPSYSAGIKNLRGPKPLEPPTEKRCSRCDQWLPLEAFRPNPRLRSGLNSWCRPCCAEATRQWREANPKYIEGDNARRREDYQSAHPLSERSCAVCNRTFTGRPDRLVCSERCRNIRKREQRQSVA